MPNGKVLGIFIRTEAGAPMQEVKEVRALVGQGLEGDAYARGEGSFNKGAKGRRQVTLINGMFFDGSGFEFADSRRNIITKDVELMWLIGREFQIGAAKFRGLKYCDPCNSPSKLSGKKKSFQQAFYDRGGLVAEVIEEGVIREGDDIIPPPKGY